MNNINKIQELKVQTDRQTDRQTVSLKSISDKIDSYTGEITKGSIDLKTLNDKVDKLLEQKNKDWVIFSSNGKEYVDIPEKYFDYNISIINFECGDGAFGTQTRKYDIPRYSLLGSILKIENYSYTLQKVINNDIDTEIGVITVCSWNEYRDNYQYGNIEDSDLILNFSIQCTYRGNNVFTFFISGYNSDEVVFDILLYK